MSTNDEEEVKVDPTDIEDLKKDLEVSTKEQPEEESTKDDESTESKDSNLTTEVPSEHDLEWYKKAYSESTSEALRQKKRADDLEKVEAPVVSEPTDDSVLTPEQLYVKQMLIKESDEAFADIVEKYPAVKDPDTYKRFSETAKVVSKSIVEAEKRLPFAKELYAKTAVIMGLQADTSEELGAALKDTAASPRTSSSTPSSVKTKVPDATIALNEKMYPNKTRAEIIEELEPHIN